MTEPTLPGMPPEPPRNQRPARPGTRIARTTQTRLCQECTRLIHVLGQAHAPYPRGGRWRVVVGETVSFLCDSHLPDKDGSP